jgi:radical SAM protein with 4Fe4S-binding SPASM domain
MSLDKISSSFFYTYVSIIFEMYISFFTLIKHRLLGGVKNMCISIRDRKTKKSVFNLQWAVTAKCDQKCKHCYMYDSPTYKSELENELNLSECKQVLDDFAYTVNKLNTTASLSFTGGDPLLREDFFDILSYAKSKGEYITAVMGNPFHLDKKTAKKLHESGVMYYQISLDGTKNTHDYFRKSGSFDATLKGYEILNSSGITSLSMFTVSKINMHELIDCIRIASECNVGVFSFDRLVPVGCGQNLKEELIDPLEYKELLLQVRDEYKRLEKSGSKTKFCYKDSLWGLVLTEAEDNEMLKLFPNNMEISRGCCLGEAGLCTLADGNLMACRRLPVIVGKVPEQKFLEVFHNSSTLLDLKNMQNIEKCGDCTNFSNCKSGCRAVAFGHSNGNYLSPDPQCWHIQNI